MINIIAAIGKNNELGVNNTLIWKLPNDLKFFKEMTINKTILMGYNTFKSLGRVLPNRKHIVITSTKLEEDVMVFNDIEKAIEYIKNLDEVFIIGGASIYEQFLDLSDRLYLTEIDDSKPADVYFPKFNKDDFDKTILSEQSENGISYKHTLYERRKQL